MRERERAVRDVEARGERVAQREFELDRRERELAAVRAELDERGEWLAAAEEALAAREREVGDLETRGAELDELIAEAESRERVHTLAMRELDRRAAAVEALEPRIRLVEQRERAVDARAEAAARRESELDALAGELGGRETNAKQKKGEEQEGAGDQGMMFGFACTESEVYEKGSFMPAPIYFAHKILKVLRDKRHDGQLFDLQPDAKSQVTVKPSTRRSRSSTDRSARCATASEPRIRSLHVTASSTNARRGSTTAIVS